MAATITRLVTGILGSLLVAHIPSFAGEGHPDCEIRFTNDGHPPCCRHPPNRETIDPPDLKQLIVSVSI